MVRGIVDRRVDGVDVLLAGIEQTDGGPVAADVLGKLSDTVPLVVEAAIAGANGGIGGSFVGEPNATLPVAVVGVVDAMIAVAGDDDVRR